MELIYILQTSLFIGLIYLYNRSVKSLNKVSESLESYNNKFNEETENINSQLNDCNNFYGTTLVFLLPDLIIRLEEKEDYEAAAEARDMLNELIELGFNNK